MNNNVGDETVPCWHMRFDRRMIPCKNPARWRTADALLTNNPNRGFLTAVRWCDEHRHPDDVPCDEEVKLEVIGDSDA